MLGEIGRSAGMSDTSGRWPECLGREAHWMTGDEIGLDPSYKEPALAFLKHSRCADLRAPEG